MIGIVVITHSKLAQELLTAAEMIVGPFPAAKAISVDRGACIDTAKQQLREVLDEVGAAGQGAIILTDMFGGTPTNISAEFLSDQVEILCGVNLPMLIKCVHARATMELPALAAMLKDYACSAVVRPAELLAAKNR